MNRTAVAACVLAVMMLGATGAAGAVKFYEPFAYAEGEVGTTASPPWSATSDWVIQSPGLSYPGLASAGNKVHWNSALADDDTGNNRDQNWVDLPADVVSMFETEGTTMYVTMLVEDTVTMLMGSDDNSIFINYSGDGGDPARFALQVERTPGGAGSSPVGEFAAASGAHLLAMRIVNQAGADVVSAVLDPDLAAGEPDWSGPGVATVDSIDMTGPITTIRLAVGRQGDAFKGGFDEICIGDTFGDCIPEPTSLVLLGTGLMCLARRRRA